MEDQSLIETQSRSDLKSLEKDVMLIFIPDTLIPSFEREWLDLSM